MNVTGFKDMRNALQGVMMGLALMFAASLLLASCGSRRVSQATAYDARDNAADEDEYVDEEPCEDCARLYIYRPGSMVGVMVSYHVHLDNEPLFRVKNKSRSIIEITQAGSYTLWGKTETREELPIDIELGQDYYIRCGVGMGAFVGRPRLELVDNETGKAEFDRIKAKIIR